MVCWYFYKMNKDNTKIKCKLLEISHFSEYLNDFEDANKAIVHQFTNWEEITVDEYYELKGYIEKQNIERAWNGKTPKEGLKYLILVREPSPDLTATTIKQMLEEKAAEKIAAEERQRKLKEDKEKARLEADKKKELRRLEKLKKQIKDLEKLKAEEAELQKKL